MAPKTIKTDIYMKGLPPTNTGATSGFMDYKRHYRLLIEKAQERVSLTGYSEKHHILPRCLGGPDEPLNLVRLTGREHFVAHWLLHRAYPDHNGLAHAFGMMANVSNGRQNRYTPSSRAIAEAVEADKKAKAKPVQQFDLDGNFIAEYISAPEAAKAVGSNQTSIWGAIGQRKNKTAAGYLWKYVEDKEPIKPLKYAPRGTHDTSKAVSQFSKDGDYIATYRSQKEAMEATGAQHISSACKGKRKSSGGFLWAYNTEMNTNTGNQIKSNRGSLNALKTPTTI